MRTVSAVLIVCALGSTAARADTLEAMRGSRRVIVLSAPDAADPRLRAQEQMLDGWRAQADDRDVSVVTVVGDAVKGASDGAADLRRTLGLPQNTFEVTLIGKDGHVAFTSGEPAAPKDLTRTIDAMPMRRQGLR